MPVYKAPVKDTLFILNDVLGLERYNNLPGFEDATPDMIEAIVGDHENPVRQAMQELLRQRLWLQENASSASLEQLDEVRSSLDAARTRIEGQLQQIERARGSLA